MAQAITTYTDGTGHNYIGVHFANHVNGQVKKDHTRIWFVMPPEIRRSETQRAQHGIEDEGEISQTTEHKALLQWKPNIFSKQQLLSYERCASCGMVREAWGIGWTRRQSKPHGHSLGQSLVSLYSYGLYIYGLGQSLVSSYSYGLYSYGLGQSLVSFQPIGREEFRRCGGLPGLRRAMPQTVARGRALVMATRPKPKTAFWTKTILKGGNGWTMML